MEKTYIINNLKCAHCGGKIEEAVKKLPEIDNAVLNFPMRKLKVSGNITDSTLAEINRIAGKIEAGVTISEPEKHHHHEHHHQDHEHEHHDHDHEDGCCCGHDHEHEHHHHEHEDNCGCGQDHEHEHHHHDHEDNCGCGHDHEHEHHHEHEDNCGCGHDHEHEHHHHDHEDNCGCGHDHEHEHHHHEHEDGCGCGHDHEHEHTQATTKTFEIHNLGCAHCGGKIEEAIKKLPEVDNAVLNFPMRKLKVTGNITAQTLAEMNQIAGKIEAGVTISEQERHGSTANAEKTYIINNLNCAHCGGKIEEAIKKLPEVDNVVLNFPMRKLKVTGNITAQTLAEMNQIAGKIEAGVTISEQESPKPVHEHHDHDHEHENTHDHGNSSGDNSGKKELISLITGALIFVAALIVHHTIDFLPVSLALFIVAYLILGYNIIISTFKNIKVGNFFDENFLMTVATIGAFFLGEYSEAVGVVLFFKIGELFEDFAVARSRKAITDVSALKVETAEILRNGTFVRVDSDEIRAGDILRIKAGERVAADGVVESGESRVDTSAVNGEPVPVTVRKGDTVMSGCINLSDTFNLRATAAASDSMISKIAQAVEDATAEKPKVDRFITQFSKVYTPIVIAVAVLTAVLGSVITHNPADWIHSALTFLVISCPCALVLSVPLAYFSGIGAASKLGILFKGGNSIEALAKVKAVIFDKTGTLTNGSFTVTDIKTLGGISDDQLLKICGSCEQISSHPVAGSIVNECRNRSLELTQPDKSGELAGRGVYAEIGGKNILCGNEKLMNEKNVVLPQLPDTIGSVVYVAVDGRAVGRIVVSDSVKKTSSAAVDALKSMGIYTAMLTGDKPENASAVGKETGVDYAGGGLMPDEKLRELNRIRTEKGAVMFVGDGINDAPVLAGADIGGAMQSGADLALEAADAVFMSSEPESVVNAKKIADKTFRISCQNIVFALAVKAIVLVLGIIGHPNMWLAVFADSGVAMLLVLNSIRALNVKGYRKK